jgi:uncharacterized membrane protein (DUF485 family)
MREVSNCLNTFLVLLTLPLYLLAPMAALAGTVIGAFAPTWLPDWLQFITTRTFLFVAVGLFVWFWIVTFIAGIRTGPTMDAIGAGIALPMFEDGISGYLLLAGVLVVGAVFKWLM